MALISAFTLALTKASLLETVCTEVYEKLINLQILIHACCKKKKFKTN